LLTSTKDWTKQDALPDWCTGRGITFNEDEGELTKAENERRYADKFVVVVLKWISRCLGWESQDNSEGMFVLLYASV
jgi:hypothetical protein